MRELSSLSLGFVATGPQSKSLNSQVQNFVGPDKPLLSLPQPALSIRESDEKPGYQLFISVW